MAKQEHVGWCVRSKRVAAGGPFLITEALAEQLACWGHLLGLANPPHTIAQGFHTGEAGKVRPAS